MKTKLGEMLGIWYYRNNGVTKYYSAIASEDGFVITWGSSSAALSVCKAIKIYDSEEMYRRILSKARGGYTQIHSFDGSWNNLCHDEFDNIDEVLKAEQRDKIKRKPRKRNLSILDWLSGVEEVRKNENFEKNP